MKQSGRACTAVVVVVPSVVGNSWNMSGRASTAVVVVDWCVRIGPRAFLSICGALPSGMGVSVQKEKNEAPSGCHHYRWGFTEHRVFDKGSPHGQLIIPHSPSPHGTLRNRLLGP